MAIVASEIIGRANRILFDTSKVRWPDTELLDYITDAQRQIVFYRPDANSKTGNVTLAQDTRQSLPVGGIRFLRAVRNMGVSGTTPGKAIREASKLALDAELPDWHSRTAAEVEHYVFDNQSPVTFYVYPKPSVASLQIEIVYAANPSKVTNVGQTLDLNDQYANAILDWVLYRCFQKDSTYAGNASRALVHLQAFANDLGVNMQSEFRAAISRSDPPVKTNMNSVNDIGAP